ncbi:hypothetical protein JXA85_07975 [Candidatus Woesearchaeota archaeon]|nr:hypothetical protein [Candidatus Woesearchaeota archaeon]
MKNKLIETLKQISRKENKIKEFKRRLRIKGRVIKKSLTKKGNFKLTVQKGDDKYNFVIMKSHKDKCALLEKLEIGAFVSAVGIRKFRAIICTQLKRIEKVDESQQRTLEGF